MALLKSEAEWLQHFGLFHEEIETQITGSYHHNESYVGHGLTADALYTSFADYYTLLTHPLIRPGDTLVDLGAGVGKATLLARTLNLDLSVLSLEYVRERHLAGVQALERLQLPTHEMICCDLMTTPVPVADHYFIYLPTGVLLAKILAELRERAQTHSFFVWVIESHGDLIPTLMNFAPFLKLHSERIVLESHRHTPFLNIFQATTETTYQSENFPFQNEINSSPHAHLLIEDRDVGADTSYLWLASTKGISMGVRPEHLQVFYPNREFHWGQLRKVIHEAPLELTAWINARERQQKFSGLGEVRKIITAPSPTIEFSQGARLPLEVARQLLT